MGSPSKSPADSPIRTEIASGTQENRHSPSPLLLTIPVNSLHSGIQDDLVTNLHEFWPWQPRLIPIPSVFHSLEKGGPFESCLQCGRNLLLAEQYMIERVFKGPEPIVEYAMCSLCVEEASCELSPESLKKVREHFLENVDPQARMERLRPLLDEDDASPWLDECLFTGTPVTDCRERQICGWFEGDQLRLDYAPFMLSGKAVEGIVDQLSEQTRGWMQDFVGDNFGLPSEFVDNPDLMPLLI
jgi:hypothetical protein